jgi:hypothetical protein
LISCGDYEYLDGGVCRIRTCGPRQQLTIGGFCVDCGLDEIAVRFSGAGVSRYICERQVCPNESYRLIRSVGGNDPYCELISCGDYEYLDGGICRIRTCGPRQQLTINGFCVDCGTDEIAVIFAGTNRYVCERQVCPNENYRLIRSVNGNDPYCELIACGDYEYLDAGVCRIRTCGPRQTLTINGFCVDCGLDEIAVLVRGSNRYVCER